MDDFDLNIDNMGRGRRRPERQVRRHDRPDPTPAPDFDDAEPVVEAMRTAPRRRRTAAKAEKGIHAQAAAPRSQVIEDEPRAAQPSPQPQRRVQRKPVRIVDSLMDRRLHLFLGFAILLFGVVMLITLVSYLHTAAADQSRVLNLSVEEMAKTPEAVHNTGGAFGAWMAHAMFSDALGLGAFVIGIYLVAMGACLMIRKKVAFWSITFKALLLAATTSVIAGLVTYEADSAVYWGGIHGAWVNKFLFDNASAIGAFAVSLLLLGADVAVFYYPLKKFCKGCAKALPQVTAPKIKLEKEGPSEDEVQPVAVAPESPVAAQPKPQEPQPIVDEEPFEEKPVTDVPTSAPVEPRPATPGAGFAIDDMEDLTDDVPETTEAFAIEDVDEPQEPIVPETPAAPVLDVPAAPTVTISAPTAAGMTLEPISVKREKPVQKEAASEPVFTITEPDDESPAAPAKVAPRQPRPMADGALDPHARMSFYQMPTVDLLTDYPVRPTVDNTEQQKNKDRIVKVLADYKITVSRISATVGPTVTLFELVPTEGTRISQIKRLEDDIAMALAAKGIRIIAPIPGKGTVGIEVPNSEPQTVSMRSVLASPKFTESDKALPVALGKTITNEVFVADLAKMPHALVAGATGQGKSVGLNAIIASLLYKKHPTELKFVLIDPKMVEFSLYSKIEKHYLAKLPDEDEAIITDSNKVLPVLNSLCVEMDNRYALLKKAGVRDMADYNRKFCQGRLSTDDGHEFMPYIVVIIDEFADLIMMGGKEIENPVIRITQKARAVGIHMIIATQRPSTNVLTGLIKANCPARVAFRVQQMVDSRCILDRPGANQLIGRGDMLYSSAGGALERVQCAFISTDEVEQLVDFIDDQPGLDTYILPDPAGVTPTPDYGGGPVEHIAGANIGGADPLLRDSAEFFASQWPASKPSTSSLQRRFSIGYNRAGKIVDQLEAAGIVSAPQGNTGVRTMLVDASDIQSILGSLG